MNAEQSPNFYHFAVISDNGCAFKLGEMKYNNKISVKYDSNNLKTLCYTM